MLSTCLYRIWFSIFVLMCLTACKGSFKSDQLAVPAGALSEALPYSEKTDYLGIIEDYAQVNVGDSIPDGSEVTEATDAAQIHEQMRGRNKKLFIRLSENNVEQEHLYKSLRSASLRLKQDPNVLQEIAYLDLRKLSNTARAFSFNDIQAKEYYVSMSKKINAMVNPSRALLINIDDLSESLSPEEFLEGLDRPNLIIMSKNNFDALQLFRREVKSNQFFPRGLNAGHIYRMMLAKFSRAKNSGIKNDAEQMALENAKTMGALDPKASLGTLAVFFKKIEGVLSAKKSRGDAKTDIKNSLANLLNRSSEYVDTLDLQTYTLKQIEEKVAANAEQFRGLSPQILAIQHSLGKIRTEDLPPIKSETDKIESVKADTNETKTVQLPQIIAEIGGVKADTNNLRTVDVPALQAAAPVIDEAGIRADIAAVKAETALISDVKASADAAKTAAEAVDGAAIIAAVNTASAEATAAKAAAEAVDGAAIIAAANTASAEATAAKAAAQAVDGAAIIAAVNTASAEATAAKAAAQAVDGAAIIAAANTASAEATAAKAAAQAVDGAAIIAAANTASAEATAAKAAAQAVDGAAIIAAANTASAEATAAKAAAQAVDGAAIIAAANTASAEATAAKAAAQAVDGAAIIAAANTASAEATAAKVAAESARVAAQAVGGAGIIAAANTASAEATAAKVAAESARVAAQAVGGAAIIAAANTASAEATAAKVAAESARAAAQGINGAAITAAANTASAEATAAKVAAQAARLAAEAVDGVAIRAGIAALRTDTNNIRTVDFKATTDAIRDAKAFLKAEITGTAAGSRPFIKQDMEDIREVLRAIKQRTDVFRFTNKGQVKSSQTPQSGKFDLSSNPGNYVDLAPNPNISLTGESSKKSLFLLALDSFSDNLLRLFNRSFEDPSDCEEINRELKPQLNRLSQWFKASVDAEPDNETREAFDTLKNEWDSTFFNIFNDENGAFKRCQGQ